MFDKEGNFKEQIRLKSSASEFFVDKESYIYTFIREFSEEGIIKVLARLDRKGNILKRIAKLVEIDIKVIRSEKGGVMGGIKHPYSQDVFFAPLLEDGLCYGNNMNYTLSIFDMEGNLKISFSRKINFQAITAEEKRKLSTHPEVIFPTHRPFFKRLLSDEKGRIWVIRVKSILDKSRTEFIDIFSKDGVYLYTAKLPCFPRIVRNGCIWVIDREIEDKTTIRKLIIKNYDSMKY